MKVRTHHLLAERRTSPAPPPLAEGGGARGARLLHPCRCNRHRHPPHAATDAAAFRPPVKRCGRRTRTHVRNPRCSSSSRLWCGLPSTRAQRRGARPTASAVCPSPLSDGDARCAARAPRRVGAPAAVARALNFVLRGSGWCGCCDGWTDSVEAGDVVIGSAGELPSAAAGAGGAPGVDEGRVVAVVCFVDNVPPARAAGGTRATSFPGTVPRSA